MVTPGYLLAIDESDSPERTLWVLFFAAFFEAVFLDDFFEAVSLATFSVFAAFF